VTEMCPKVGSHQDKVSPGIRVFGHNLSWCRRPRAKTRLVTTASVGMRPAAGRQEAGAKPAALARSGGLAAKSMANPWLAKASQR